MKAMVVTAALIVEGRKILVSQRKEDVPQALLWEFPGGKVNKEEEPRQALRRELEEELGIKAEVGPLVDVVFHNYPEYSVLLLIYLCRLKRGIPTPLGCRDLRWVDVSELETLPMPQADQPIQKHLRELCSSLATSTHSEREKGRVGQRVE